jgi:hypothetical protein
LNHRKAKDCGACDQPTTDARFFITCTGELVWLCFRCFWTAERIASASGMPWKRVATLADLPQARMSVEFLSGNATAASGVRIGVMSTLRIDVERAKRCA